MKCSSKILLAKLSAIIICTVPVTVVTLNYFPVWKNRGSGALLSGFTVFLLIICLYPTVKALRRYLKSPSVFTIWLLLFAIFMVVKSIAYEMCVISFVGMISNLIGSIIFKLCGRRVNYERDR